MMKRNILTLAMLAVATAAVAQQNLKTEIDVDRTVVPLYRDMERPASIAPALLPTPSMSAQLTPAEYLLGGNATPTMSLLPAAAWADSIALTPYRGYASVGYFPSFNLGVNAGCRVIDTPRATLGLWLQYSGRSYNGDATIQDFPYLGVYYDHYWPADARADDRLDYGFRDKVKMKRHTLTVGADGAYQFGQSSRLTYGLDYTNVLVGIPDLYFEKDDYDRKANHFDARVGFDSRINNLAYGVKGSFGYFGLNTNYGSKHLKTTSGTIDLNVGYCPDDELIPVFGADVDFDILRSTIKDWTAENMIETHIRPYYRYHSGMFSARVGLNLSIAGGACRSGTVLLAPDVELSLATIQFSAYLQAKGGEHLNTPWQMFMLDNYVSGELLYYRTNVPLDLKFGVGVGPFSGFSAEAFIQYARVRNWHTPELSAITPVWSIHKYNGTRVGASARYDYDKLLTINASYVIVLSGKPYKTWYEWIDGSRSELSASATLRPFSPLSVTLGYRLRADRSLVSINPFTDNLDDIRVMDLGNISDLSARVDYQITPAVTVFAIGQNLLSHRYWLPSALPSAGLTGSIGIAAKF